MMKKFLALLMILVMLPISAVRANEVVEYGSVDAAMDAYAQRNFKFYKNKLAPLTQEGTLAFRTTVDEVYGRDSHDGDKSKLMGALTTLGFTVTENDSVWLTDRNQVALNLRYLLLLAQMDTMPFEDAVKQAETWMPDYNLGKATFGVAADVFVNLLGGKLMEMVQADSIVYALDFIDAGKALQKGNFLSRTMGKAIDYAGRHYADVYQAATTATEITKSLSGYLATDPALLNLTNSTNQALTGTAYLEAMFAGGVRDPHLSKACTMLSEGYKAFLTEIEELGKRTDTHDKLQDEAYLASRFEAILQQKLEGYLTAKDAITSAAAGALTIADIIVYGGWGQVMVKGGVNVLGEAALGTASTYSHFHAMAVLDEIFAAMADGASAELSSWEDYAAYARTIQRLCNIALLGESHIYQLTTEDAGAGQKVWNMLKYEVTGTDEMAQRTAWYNQRLEYLHGLYSAAQEYLTGLYAHHDKLLAEAQDVTSLLGHENELTLTISGEITQDKYFALPDGSGPDLDNPNPDADEPVEGIPVKLVTLVGEEEQTIASATTDAEGRYTLVYPVMAAKNLPLTLTVGDENSDDFVVKENVSALNIRDTAFRSSFRWNPDTEYLPVQSAAEAAFPLPYANDLFLGSDLSYDHNLALASLGLSAAAMSDPDADGAWAINYDAGRDSNIRAAWASLGFSVVASSGYDQSLNSIPEAPGYTIAVKTFEDPDDLDEQRNPKQYRVVGVAIRGDVDMAELATAFMAAGDDSDYAGNVRRAAMAILPALEDAVLSGWREDVPTKVWITGFSRGGAIAGQLSDLVRLRSSLNSRIRGLYAYTFGAPGSSSGGYSVSTSSSGIFNIVCKEDWVATGLLHALRYGYGNPGTSLDFGAAKAGPGRYKIASAFHLLTDGNSAYDPLTYTPDSTLRTLFSGMDEARSDTLYVRELQPIVTAVMQLSFLRNSSGDDFRTLSLETKHGLASTIPGKTLSKAAVSAMLDDVLVGAQATFFKALPADMQANLTAYLGDVLRLAAIHSGEGASFRLSEDMAPVFLPMVMAMSDDFSAPTALYSSLYAHHPEIYMAWLLGLDGEALFGQDVCVKFSTPILPWDKNLFGTVIDAESKKPLVNVPVHIVGGYGEDAVDRTLYTDEKGKWDTFVKPADYTVTFELPGYEHKETRIYQSEVLVSTLSNHAGVPVTKSQLETARVEMETELQALAHDSIVITSTAHYETGSYYWVRIEHPYVYSTKNPELYNSVESIVGPLVDKAHASASKLRNSSHTGCAWDMEYHEEIWFYLGTAYATDDMLSLTLNRGSFICSIGHNMPNRTGYTFDIATGKRLTLDDLLDPANPNAKKDFLDQITQALKEESGYFDLSEHYSASKVYKYASKQETPYSWYMLNDGIEMMVPAIAGGGQNGFFIPYTRLEGIIAPKYLPAENIGSATVKAVRRENLLDDYDGQLIYNDNGASTTGVQLDGLATHVWIDERTSSPVASCGRYFYGYKVKDVTVMMPEDRSAVGVAWTDYLGDHFETIGVLPEPVVEDSLPEDEYLP